MTITLTAPTNFFREDWYDVIVGQLHAGQSMLGELLVFTVSSRTPVDTGALQADVSWENGSGDEIGTVYSAQTEQLAEWGRVYELYQEGALLGLSTYTNSPHEMYAKVLTDDVPAIEDWGNQWLQRGADLMTTGAEVWQ